MKRKAVLLALGIGIAVSIPVLSALQKSLIYFPSRAPERVVLEEARRVGLEPWRNSSGILIGWRTPRFATPAKRLLVFHGNGGYALHRIYLAALPPQEWQVSILEYPGYGARSGTPEESALKAAALAAFDALASESPQTPIHLAGESLGSGVATWLASQRPAAVAGVLLITPMTSLGDLAARHYPFLPVRLLLTERYDSTGALQAYAGPAAFVVAGRDELVPAELGRKLHAGYQGRKRLWEQPAATHNTLSFDRAWWAPVFAFLAED